MSAAPSNSYTRSYSEATTSTTPASGRRLVEFGRDILLVRAAMVRGHQRTSAATSHAELPGRVPLSMSAAWGGTNRHRASTFDRSK
jgi:hypothetical protein